ncbi:SDR family oxidoreductase [Ideonella livida]|uniref:SDR family oxidoreductase n=1 Tax=Ideonella livida TaxID=2707176 RepID=A0A7C9TNS8_9BURK|nr:SDR family oxidoreductase [Ideonella livida]NDY93885.1 SDR family oxidoreductase [Ideonella livida]
MPSLPSPPATAHHAPRPVALVTGAARRIGRAITLHLAAQGWDVALHCHASHTEAEATAAEARAAGGPTARTTVLAADLADDTACRALLPAAVAALGRVDAVVNNASLFEYDDASSASSASLARHWQANTAAPVALAQALATHLAARRATGEPQAQGCVVNLLDQKLWNPNPDYFSYTLSKAALKEATTLLAQALAPAVRVCGVAPGVTLVSGPLMSEGQFAAAHRLTPLGRSSTPEDIARAVAFVLTSPAITGTTLLVDGGQHLAAQGRDVLFLTGAATPAAPSA